MTKTFEVIKKQNGGLISLARFCGARSARQRRSSQIIHGTVVLCTRCLAVRAEHYIFFSSELEQPFGFLKGPTALLKGKRSGN
jgi:hypothetical protein